MKKKNTSYTCYFHPNHDPCRFMKFRVDANSIKEAIKKWSASENAKWHELFMVQECVEYFV